MKGFNLVIVCSIAIVAFALSAAVGDAAGWRGRQYQRVCGPNGCSIVPVSQIGTVTAQTALPGAISLPGGQVVGYAPNAPVGTRFAFNQPPVAAQAPGFVFTAANCVCGPNCPANFGQVCNNPNCGCNPANRQAGYACNVAGCVCDANGNPITMNGSPYQQVGYAGPVATAVAAPFRAVGAIVANGVDRRQSRRESRQERRSSRGGFFGGFFRGCASCG